MKLSVVCPTFNSEDYVRGALESVINQTVPPYELILSDDGSIDRTIELLESYSEIANDKFKYKILTNTHRGPGATRNSAILAADGDWIAFLDSDDEWEKNKLSEMIKIISKYPAVNFICHNEICVRKNGISFVYDYGKNYNKSKSLMNQLYFRNMFSTSAICCKKELLLNNGLFDETLMSAQDYELWLRLSPHLNIFFSDMILGKYIEREGNITSGNMIKRMINEFKIALWHRKNITHIQRLIKFARICASFTNQFFQSLYR